jgi:hypothetical protein
MAIMATPFGFLRHLHPPLGLAVGDPTLILDPWPKVSMREIRLHLQLSPTELNLLLDRNVLPGNGRTSPLRRLSLIKGARPVRASNALRASHWLCANNSRRCWTVILRRKVTMATICLSRGMRRMRMIYQSLRCRMIPTPSTSIYEIIIALHLRVPDAYPSVDFVEESGCISAE